MFLIEKPQECKKNVERVQRCSEEVFIELEKIQNQLDGVM
jgi:hypothetical protein